jgi:VCBS repeat-containing protein
MNNLTLGGELIVNKKRNELTRIFVRGDFELKSGTGAKVKPGNANDYGRILIYVTGKVKINPGSFLGATLIAPNADIKVKPQVTVFGQIMARSLSLEIDFDATKGQFHPWSPPQISLVGANVITLPENTDATNTNHANNSRMISLPIALSELIDANASVQYTVRQKSGANSATLGDDFILDTLTSTSSGTLTWVKNTLTPNESVQLFILDDTDFEGNELVELKIYKPQMVELANDPNATQVYKTGAVVDSLIYHIPIVSDDIFNSAPTAMADAYSTDEDQTLNVAANGVLSNDIDAENNINAALMVSSTTNGTLTLNIDGSFAYTPNLNFVGLDSFVYKASDGLLESGNVTVNITINAVNDLPTTVADAYTLNENDTLNVAVSGVLSNDTDVENNSLTAVLVSSVTNGSLTLNADGSFDYIPNPNYNGTDSFTYKARDTEDGSVATVTITINGVKYPPVSVADSYNVNEDQTLTVAAGGVLSNDVDSDGDVLTAELVSTTTNGNLTLNSDGSFTYVPKADFNGNDSFTYKSKDSMDGNVVSVSISVAPVNDAPRANDLIVSAKESSPFGNVLGQLVATDVDGDPITFALKSVSSVVFVSSAGEVSLLGALDYETTKQHTIPVYVVSLTDTIEVNLILNVENVIEKTVVEIVSAQNSQNIWKDPKTVYTNKPKLNVDWTVDGIAKDSVWKFTNGKSTFSVKSCDPTKDDCGEDEFHVYFNDKAPEIEVDKVGEIIDPQGNIVTNDPDKISQVKITYLDETLEKITTVVPIDSTLVEGENTISVFHEDVYGNKTELTYTIILDTTPPKVKINSPRNNETLSKAYADVDWQIDGVVQDTALLESLVEGKNIIIRSHTDLVGNFGADTVLVRLKFKDNDIDVTLVDSLINISEQTLSVDEFYQKKGRSSIPDKEIYSVMLVNQVSGKKQEVAYGNLGGSTTIDPVDRIDVADDFAHLGFALKVDLTFPSSEVGGGKKFGDCQAGEEIWIHSVQAIRVDIFDVQGQFVDGFYVPAVEVPQDYLSKDGKAHMFVEKPVDLAGKMVAENGNETGTGIYLMSVAVTIASKPTECNTISRPRATTRTLMRKAGYQRRD